MLEIEILVLIIINSAILYVVYKKTNDNNFSVQDNFIESIKPIKKAFTKGGKRKPVVNDDFKVWLQEKNSENRS